MMNERLPDPVLVTKPSALARMAEALSREPVIAVDTESNSLYAYQEQVCLIQFSTPEVDYLVDPLVLDDLSILAPLFADPKIEKVFHAAEYDLICLKRDFGFEFKHLFDTMVAARILGREAFGLGSLLKEEFGVELDKRFQRANWGQRPLPPELLAYARLDTHYLIELSNRLREDLHRARVWPLAKEDFERMAIVNGSAERDSENKVQTCWRVSGAFDLEPQQAAVLMELCKYRDQVAQTLNRPLFKVINDRTLLAIAQDAPRNLRELGQIPGMTRGQVDRHGRAILAAVQRGLKAQPIHPPRPVRPSDDYLERVEALRRWRKVTAENMGVKSDVVLPRDLMMAIAVRNPEQMADLAEVMRGSPWRLEHFGEEILEVLRVAQP